MTKDKFLMAKNELINTIIKFELLQRKSNFLRQTYLLELAEEIKREMKYSFENEVMINSIKKIKDGSSIDVVKKDILLSKKELKNKMNSFEIQLKEANELSKRCISYTLDDIKNLDSKFAEFCSLYHPILKGRVSDIEQNMYKVLSKLYRDGNIEAFDKFYLECEDKFVSTDVSSNFEGYIYFYNESITNLNNLIDKMEKSFPLNIEEKFANYDSITNLISEKRESVYNLRELNKVIKKDYFLNFNEEF